MNTKPLSATNIPSMFITATVLAISSLTVMANATIAPSLPGLAAAFSNTPNIETLSGMVLSLPSLSVVLTAALFGLLADRFDRRKLLVAVMLLYAAGGASGLFARTMPELLAGRIALGIGVAGTMTIATLLATDLWQGPSRARFMGWQGAAMSAGGILFLLAGGALAEINWRGPFMLYLAALPLALVAWVALVGKTNGQSSSANVAVVQFPWLHFVMIGMLAAFSMVMFYIIPTRLPFLMKSIGIASPAQSGIAIAAMTAASLPGALLFGRIRMRFSHEMIFAIAFSLMAAGYGLIAMASNLTGIIAATVTAGLGFGTMMPNLTLWLMAKVPPEARGKAAGLLTTAIFAGQFASPIVSGLVAGQAGLATTFTIFAGSLLAVAIIMATLAAKSAVTKTP
jgi:MFS family permease